MGNLKTIDIIEILDKIKDWRDLESEKLEPNKQRIETLEKLYQCVKLSIVSNQALQRVQKENTHLKVLLDVYRTKCSELEFRNNIFN